MRILFSLLFGLWGLVLLQIGLQDLNSDTALGLAAFLGAALAGAIFTPWLTGTPLIRPLAAPFLATLLGGAIAGLIYDIATSPLGFVRPVEALQMGLLMAGLMPFTGPVAAMTWLLGALGLPLLAHGLQARQG